ncbi:MAG TPA: tetratricopeptide repeat protein, partial [Steroidobacteraceae bacterium]|nr:tetratricopeptide repeat protein [Steroidobacteraceae bacterium]
MSLERARSRGQARRLGRALCVALGCLGVLLADSGQARGIPYGELSDPAVQRCDALNWSPRHAAAAACYRALGGEGPAAAAEGAWALGELARANELFRTAAAARPNDAGVRRRWAELYIDSHQPQQAQALFREALLRDARDSYARIGAASVLDGQFAIEAQAQLDAALSEPTAPTGARLRGLLLKARAALEEADADTARALLQQATVLADSGHWPHLELDALQAALAQLQNQDDAPWVQRALREDPAYGEAYALPAQIADIRWRDAEAVALYRQALAIEPTLWSARRALADCLLRQGQLAAGRAMLESA